MRENYTRKRDKQRKKLLVEREKIGGKRTRKVWLGRIYLFRTRQNVFLTATTGIDFDAGVDLYEFVEACEHTSTGDTSQNVGTSSFE